MEDGPVVTALKLLADAFPNSFPNIFSYRLRFKELWGIGCPRLSRDELTKDKPLLIVWDGWPEDITQEGFDIRAYLTPLDWAVAFSLGIDRELREQPHEQDYLDIERTFPPRLQILILDLASDAVGDAPALRFYDSFSGSIPWIRMLKPTSTLLLCLLQGMRYLEGQAPTSPVAASTKEQEESLLERLWEWMPFLRWMKRGKVITPYLAKREVTTTEKLETRPEIDIKTLARYWQTNFLMTAEMGGHHALANYIGPLVLASQHEHIGSQALLSMMRWIGLAPSESVGRESDESTNKNATNATTKAWVDWKNIEPTFQSDPKCGALNFLLLDDFALRLGWGKVLCDALGATYQGGNENGDPIRKIGHLEAPLIDVYASDSPDAFLASAGILGIGSERNAPSDAKGRIDSLDRRFELMFGANQLDVLLLDLRLFQRASEKVEAQFYKRLLPLASRFLSSRGEEEGKAITRATSRVLPWQAIPERDIEQAKRWIDSHLDPDAGQMRLERETDEHWQALTLLPRILALVDFSLPIILFSSTGKRRIVNILSPYRNIIVDFEKLRLDKLLSEDFLEEIKRSFRRAIEKALEMVEGRRHCAKVISSRSEIAPEKKYEHVEIYIDENTRTEFSPFKVVGLLVGYPNKKVTDTVQSQMYAARMRGFPLVNLEDLDRSENLLPSGKQLPFKQQYERRRWIAEEAKIPEVVGKILVDNRCMAVPFAFYRDHDQSPNPERPDQYSKALAEKLDTLCDPDGIDNRYVDLVHTALGALLFGVGPEYLSLPEGTLSVFCATRRRPFHILRNNQELLEETEEKERKEDSKRVWQSLFDRWGITGYVWNRSSDQPIFRAGSLNLDLESQIGDAYYKTVESDSVYPILDALFRKHNHSAVKPRNIYAGLGIMLKELNEPSHKSFRHVHYLADLIGHCNSIDPDDRVAFHEFDAQWGPVEFNSLTPIGERCSEDFKVFSTISHLLESGNESDTTVALLGSSIIKRRNPNMLDTIVNRKLANALNKLSGADFMRFIELRRVADTASFTSLSSPKFGTGVPAYRPTPVPKFNSKQKREEKAPSGARTQRKTSAKPPRPHQSLSLAPQQLTSSSSMRHFKPERDKYYIATVTRQMYAGKSKVRLKDLKREVWIVHSGTLTENQEIEVQFKFDGETPSLKDGDYLEVADWRNQ